MQSWRYSWWLCAVSARVFAGMARIPMTNTITYRWLKTKLLVPHCQRIRVSQSCTELINIVMAHEKHGRPNHSTVCSSVKSDWKTKQNKTKKATHYWFFEKGNHGEPLEFIQKGQRYWKRIQVMTTSIDLENLGSNLHLLYSPKLVRHVLLISHPIKQPAWALIKWFGRERLHPLIIANAKGTLDNFRAEFFEKKNKYSSILHTSFTLNRCRLLKSILQGDKNIYIA